ncbi:unnamed protein product [Lactuca saligna]|uniref:RNA helicase n=1 Tax=Lactuca saligna TaxID=75948 RepID=A0AA36E623_LACSI|nr:unnamed protein product [Lactuca saligna]
MQEKLHQNKIMHLMLEEEAQKVSLHSQLPNLQGSLNQVVGSTILKKILRNWSRSHRRFGFHCRTARRRHSQSIREATIVGFRSGKFMTLVATDVAARGLDINESEPPRDVEDYIHRSGTTGRAGNSGVAITLYEPRKSNISKLEREASVKFEHISAPQHTDIAKVVGGDAAEVIIQVVDCVIPVFKSAVEELLNNFSLAPVQLLAKARAKSIRYTEIKHMSLVSYMENNITLHLEARRPVYTPSLEKDYGMKYNPYEAGVDVFLFGYVFHLKILHKRGLNLFNGQSESYQVKRVSSMVARKELRMLKLRCWSS